MDPYQEFLWRQTMRMDANGATPAQIAEYIRTAERNNLRALIMGEPDQAPEYPGMVRGLSQQVIRGVTFGFGDEALGTLAGMISPRFSRQEGRDLMRAEMEAFQAEHPRMSLGANIAGGLAVPGLALAGGASKLAAAGVGAAAGAVAGAGEAEGSLAERAPEAALGAALGAVFGPAVSYGANRAGRVVGAVVRRLPEGFKEKISTMMSSLPGSPQRNGLEAVAQGLDLDGKTPAAVAAQIRARADAGMHTTLSEVGGDHTMAVIETAQEFRTPEQQAFAQNLVTRGMQAGERLLTAMGAGTRVGLQNAYRLRTHLSRIREREAKPFYDTAFHLSVRTGPETRRLLTNPLWREVYEEGRKVALQEEAGGIARGLAIPQLADDAPVPDVLPVRALDYMKKGIDALEARVGADNKPVLSRAVARGYRAQINNVLAEVDEQVPIYQQGRAIWQGHSQALDAIEDGMHDFATSSPDEIREALARSPAPDFYRIGVMQHLADVVHGATNASAKDAERFFGANLFGAADRTQLAKIQAVFDDPDVALEFADRVAGEAASAYPVQRLGGPRTPNPERATAEFAPRGPVGRVMERMGIALPREDKARQVANEVTRIHALGLDDPYELADLIESIPIFRRTSRAATGAARTVGAATAARETQRER